MPSLLDQAIEVGKQLEGSDQRLTALKTEIAQTEEVLNTRQQELAKLERESAQRIKAEQTTWEQTHRDQAAALKQREDDVTSKESALASFPDQVEALTLREQAVLKREAEAEATWQRAKQAEIDWHVRDAELEAKAADINKLKATG